MDFLQYVVKFLTTFWLLLESIIKQNIASCLFDWVDSNTRLVAHFNQKSIILFGQGLKTSSFRIIQLLPLYQIDFIRDNN